VLNVSRFPPSPARIPILTRQLRLLNQLLAAQPGRADLARQGHEAIVELASVSRDVPEIQFLAAQQLSDTPGEEAAAKRLRYRAMAMDARCRTFDQCDAVSTGR
jgi:hypothetical protein